MQELIKNIETIAHDEGITEIEAITLMQAGAAQLGNEEMLDALCEIKITYISGLR